MSDGKTASKKTAVLGGAKPKRKGLGLAAGIGAAVLVLAGAYYFVAGRGVGLPTGPTVAEAAGGEISLPVAQFSDGKARFYKLEAQGVAVRYYAVKGSDGAMHTAYDACDACWHSGKGYKQAGDVMVCQNCNRTFAINEIGQVHGGCNPSPLKHEVRSANLVIRVADVQAGRRYFDLSKAG
ncbi:MAG: DUF2318 domain-containing protein [Deltaproteobacteria bacterium]|nr:DUF2318 domain-containing protein [Deltaproteobacteria bacterium]